MYLPNPGLNPGLPHHRQILHSLSHQESPIKTLKAKVTQSCLTLCNPMDGPWNSPGQNTGVDSLSLLQRIFPTQESNRDPLHCRQILYQLSYQGSPIQTPERKDVSARLVNILRGVFRVLAWEDLQKCSCLFKADNCGSSYIFLSQSKQLTFRTLLALCWEKVCFHKKFNFEKHDFFNISN